jgi:hypothetical protein
MIEPGKRASFAGEALSEPRVARDLGGKDFNSEQTVEFRLPRLIHGTHAALAYQAQNLQLGEMRG